MDPVALRDQRVDTDAEEDDEDGNDRDDLPAKVGHDSTSLCIRGLDDGRLALQAANGGTRDLDSDLRIVGDLQLDHLLVDFRDLAVYPARRDDPVVHLEAVEKLLHLLLLTLRRQQDDEVEDA